MGNRWKGFVVPVFLIAMMLMFSGCSATQTAIKHRKLVVDLKMSDTLFLDVMNMPEKTVFVDIRNTSQYDFDIQDLIETKLTQRGYEVKNDPRESHYILQANILYVSDEEPETALSLFNTGYGGTTAALQGLIVGGAIGGLTTQRWQGAGVAGMAGSAVGFVADSMVEDVTFSMVVDLQIAEKTDAEIEQKTESNLSHGSSTKVQQVVKDKTNLIKYKTRILATANKVNLKFETAKPALESKLAQSIVGIF